MALGSYTKHNQQRTTYVFTPSSYDTDLTMDGTAQGVALASDVAVIRIVNRGATTEGIRVAFGTSETDAEGNLTISAGAATTGLFIPSPADGDGTVLLGVPATATHYAIANDTASDVQIVSVTQGV